MASRGLYPWNKMATPSLHHNADPDSKVHGANMGPIWGRHDPGGPHVGPMNFAIWVMFLNIITTSTDWLQLNPNYGLIWYYPVVYRKRNNILLYLI